MAEVNPNQPTTEILFKDIVVRRLATDPQTLKDFFFDRCITTKGPGEAPRRLCPPHGRHGPGTEGPCLSLQTLLIDLDFTPREIEGWLAQGHLGRNIVMHLENNLGKIPESLMMWLMAHIWIFGLEPGAALQEDVPVFKFSDEDKEFLGQFDAPPEWAGMRTLEIESAMEWELEIVRSLARVRAVTEPKGFLKKWLLGPEEEEEEEYPLTCERCLEPDNWRKLYSSWEWRQKIADMWYGSPRTDWMKK
ncbi:hypothetical protein CABS01_13242 [Colletotrichum abscissum]|uniref:uncharacterized protein n=1 Tax=Colletotrichum abscissum TaxID=1671311 RepID=UPI0027D6E848|nr:uncharacterized protein CABS01_13242 [Colletotrichum abscissum]KAK1486614.1 hypothetical protein CABS01_13242 [Colletotrichum abscissum]